MARKKHLIFVISSISCAALIGSLTTSFDSFHLINADPSLNLIMTFDDSNQPDLDDGNATLIYNQFASFNYTNASLLTNGHVTLGPSGTFSKNQVSNSLASINANFLGDLILYSGYQEDNYCYSYELTSELTQSIRGNYFELISPSGADIFSIVLTFGCLEAEEESHNFSELWQYDDTYHWKECLDPHCHEVSSKGVHVANYPSLIAPTESNTGRTGDIYCSVCNKLLLEDTILPVLSSADYDVSHDTRLIDDNVRDIIVYTWKQFNSLSFSVVGEILTTYIHAGTSYYSIERWNEIFPNQHAEVEIINNQKHFTMTLYEDTVTTITASDGVSPLDGMLDFTLYETATIKGLGTLNVSYSTIQDGINAYSLIVDEGATVNLTGFNPTRMSGIKVFKNLQVDGTLNVTNFGFGHAIASSTSGDYNVTITVGTTGTYHIYNCGNGIYGWSNFSKAIDITILGTLDITAYYSGTSTDYGNGINILKSGAKLNIFGTVNINATNTSSTTTSTGICGHGLNIYRGYIYLRDNADVSIICTGHAINNFYKFICAGSNDGNTVGNVNLSCKTSCGNGIYSHDASSGYSSIAINTLGKVILEKDYPTTSKTGIQIGNKGTSGDVFMIKCADMTIKGFNYAMGSWKSGKVQTRTYEYTGDYNKIKIVNCASLYNTDSSYANTTFFSAFTSSTVEIISGT